MSQLARTAALILPLALLGVVAVSVPTGYSSSSWGEACMRVRWQAVLAWASVMWMLTGVGVHPARSTAR